ncbi:MAG: hypothetical protein O6768_00575 [Planctomycetota bacterium]|nr:hypothetical protein [Planctomycetota bacterium]
MTADARTFHHDEAGLWKRAVRALIPDVAGSGRTIGELATALRPRLVEAYDGIRLYHGCSPARLDSYWSDGIVPMTPDRLTRTCRSHLMTDQDPGDVRRNFENILEIQTGLIYADKVSFHLYAEVFHRIAGYYLIYGSHSVFAVAVLLSRMTGIDFRRRLAGTGRPTVLTCDIPLARLSIGQLARLCEFLAAGVVAGDDGAGRLRIADFHLEVEGSVAPWCIVAHDHPVTVEDSIYGNHLPLNDGAI